MRDAMRTQCETDMRFADATDGRTDERRSRITFACESNSRNAQEQQGEADPIVSDCDAPGMTDQPL